MGGALSLLTDKSVRDEVNFNNIPEHILDYLLTHIYELKEVNEPAFNHSLMVSKLCLSIGRYFSHLVLSRNFINELSLAGLMHDVGKKDPLVANLTLVKRHLSAKEFEKVKKHPVIGARIIDDMPIDERSCYELELKSKLLATVSGHHIWHNAGNNFSYPHGICYSSEILVFPQLVMIADTLSACLDNERVYKGSTKSFDHAYRECCDEFDRGKFNSSYKENFDLWWQDEIGER